jgi:hypothetical protein
MKNAFTFCVLLLTVILAQAQHAPTIKTMRILDGKKEMFLARHDEKGNQYFVKNDGMNGPLMIWAVEYDTAGRELRSIFAHANMATPSRRRSMRPAPSRPIISKIWPPRWMTVM